MHIVLGMWNEAGVCLKSITRWQNVQNIYFYLIYVSWTTYIFLSKYGRKKLRQKTIATIATSTTYLMMLWSLTSVAHEQLWYWPLTMNRPLPSTTTELRWKEYMHFFSWWRHQMETFPALLAHCAGNSPIPVDSPHKGQWRGALMFSLICAHNKRLSKEPWGWWFKTPSGSLWRHCNVLPGISFRLLSADI